MELLIIFGLLVSSYAMVSSKRISALIGNFRVQSLFLCAMTFLEAYKHGRTDLYIISVLVFVIKVLAIPKLLIRIADEIQVNENLGFYVSPQLSLLLALLFTYLSWVLSEMLFTGHGTMLLMFAAVSFSMMFLGMFIMVFRMKALAQIVGLLAMENGIFLLAASAGGMPFLVEMAVFFDIFVGVIILGIFVYRINKLFVSIDVSKLNRLKG